MDITITDETDDTVEFDFEGGNPAMANALRRTMIGDIPTIAVENVTFTANNSGLFDEIIAHRLGLLPWQFEEGKYEFRDECDCEDGCPNCTVHLALQAEGPGAVTADDLSAPADDVAPANPEAKIVDLKEDGELELEAEAVLGVGKDHAKWQAANVSYAYEDDTFHFTVESVSGIPPREIVTRALDRLEDAVDGFEEAVDGHL